MAPQSTLDLPKLDTKATDLHLIVRSSQILQVPVRSIPSHLPRTVHPRARCTIWTRNKTLRRQSTTLQIAPCQPRSRDIQLPGYPNRNRAQSPVQHIYLVIRHRRPDRDETRLLSANNFIGGTVNAALCWSIEIKDPICPSGLR